ncbi:MAG: thioredoxin family protein [Armatimonadota bacterium]
MRLATPAILLSGLLLSSAFSFASPQGAAPAQALPSEKIFDPSRDAEKDLKAGIRQAAKEKKRILVDVGGNWCSWCHKLDKLFQSDAEIGKLLKAKYVIVKVNFSQENDNKALLSKFPKISGYPHLFVLDAKGKLLHSQDTGLLETGPAHDPVKVMDFLKKWAL